MATRGWVLPTGRCSGFDPPTFEPQPPGKVGVRGNFGSERASVFWRTRLEWTVEAKGRICSKPCQWWGHQLFWLWVLFLNWVELKLMSWLKNVMLQFNSIWTKILIQYKTPVINFFFKIVIKQVIVLNVKPISAIYVCD